MRNLFFFFIAQFSYNTFVVGNEMIKLISTTIYVRENCRWWKFRCMKENVLLTLTIPICTRTHVRPLTHIHIPIYIYICIYTFKRRQTQPLLGFNKAQQVTFCSVLVWKADPYEWFYSRTCTCTNVCKCNLHTGSILKN